MKSINHKICAWGLILLTLTSGCAGHSQDSYISGSAEEVFWQRPATIHSLTKQSDLHNRFAAILAITELEFVRLGDFLISFIIRSKIRPLESTVDSIGLGYNRLPQVRVVRRVGELVDAFQLPELSLSDARSFFLFSAGNNSSVITPIMQMRIYKIIVWIEDVIYDLDDLIMWPINYPASVFRGKKTDMQTIGYLGTGLGKVRAGLFTSLWTVNGYVMRFSSNLLKRLEGGVDYFIRRKRMRQNAGFPIYARMPYGVFQEHRGYFKKHKNHYLAASGKAWAQMLALKNNPVSLLEKNAPPFPPSETLAAQDSVLLLIRARDWRKSPDALRSYVITEEEFQSMVMAQEKPS